jgi:thymidylate synthase
MNTIDKKYTDLLQDILDNGVTKQDRTGTGTLSVFGRQIRHKMLEGFPLLTTKKMYFKGIVTELLWFLRGYTNIKYLVDNDCNIWTGDAYKNYVKTSEPTLDGKYLSQPEFIHWIKTDDEFAKKWGDLGKIYGKQWRGWDSYDFVDDEVHTIKIDQIANLINDLKTNPDSRRMMVTAWNPSDLESSVLPPCHYGFQVYTRELTMEEKSQYKRENKETYPVSKWRDDMGISKEEYFNQIGVPTRTISLMWNQRSVDTGLGLPFNLASYGLLLEIIAKEVNMVPDELIGNLGDTHLYLNHIEQAKEQIGREYTLSERVRLAEEINGNLKHQTSIGMSYIDDTLKIPTRTRQPYPLPTLVINDEFWNQDDSIFNQIEHITPEDFFMENYQSHPTIKMPLSN